MSFENDYRAFIKALYLKDYLDAERILSTCDTKSMFISKAITDLGEYKVKTLVEGFRSTGLKRSLDNILEEYKSSIYESSESYEKSSEKIVLVHHKNKIKNQLFHLSGSSFPNEIVY